MTCSVRRAHVMCHACRSWLDSLTAKRRKMGVCTCKRERCNGPLGRNGVVCEDCTRNVRSELLSLSVAKNRSRWVIDPSIVADAERARGVPDSDVQEKMVRSVAMLEEQLVITLVVELKSTLSTCGRKYDSLWERWRAVIRARRRSIERAGLTIPGAAAKTTTSESSGAPASTPVAGRGGTS